MRLEELQAAVEPLVALLESACASEDPIVVRAGIVLSAVVGSLDPEGPDLEVLDELAKVAGALMAHQLGHHAGAVMP